MNTQELFDKCAGHLLAQNQRSLRAAGNCAYRGVEGQMCAVGCLIDDNHYDVGLEGQCSDDKDVEMAIEGTLGFAITWLDRRLLRELQETHDNYSPHEWREHLRVLAVSYGLQFNHDRKAA